jgi:hypothetical protein
MVASLLHTYLNNMSLIAFVDLGSRILGEILAVLPEANQGQGFGVSVE